MKKLSLLLLVIVISCSPKVTTDPLGLEMVEVTRGTFIMGSPVTESNRKRDEVEHSVNIEKDFLISKYEVTQELYLNITGENPSKFKNPENPVESIDWYEAIEFCNLLSLKSGFLPVYTIDKENKDPNNHLIEDRKGWMVPLNPGANGYRLPTEEEWEYSAKGGASSRGYTFSGSDKPGEVAVTKSNNGPERVGSKKPNELGIYDITGNLFEWCNSWYSPYESDNTSGKRKVVRGGSWLHLPSMSRNSKRSYRRPDYGDEIVGFRVVRNK